MEKIKPITLTDEEYILFGMLTYRETKEWLNIPEKARRNIIQDNETYMTSFNLGKITLFLKGKKVLHLIKLKQTRREEYDLNIVNHLKYQAVYRAKHRSKLRKASKLSYQKNKDKYKIINKLKMDLIKKDPEMHEAFKKKCKDRYNKKSKKEKILHTQAQHKRYQELRSNKDEHTQYLKKKRVYYSNKNYGEFGPLLRQLKQGIQNVKKENS